MRKIDIITELYNRTLKELTSSNRAWLDFLGTASYQYKYSFSDKVLIYAQRPTAIACTELEIWNKRFGRWVNKGAHGIALIRDRGGRATLTHVFDVRDTHHSEDVIFKLWQIRSEMHRDIAEALENRFGTLQMKATIADAAICACDNICEDNLTDYLDNLMDLVNGSLLDEYDEDNLRVRLLPLLKFSTAYSVLTRLGFNAIESLDIDELSALREFNTTEVINLLGSATGDISEICLREIEKTVSAYEKNKNRTFAENENVRYNENEKEIFHYKGGKENEYEINAEVQEAGRRDDSRFGASRTDELSVRQVRTDETRIFEEASQGDLHDTPHTSEAEQTSSRSGNGGTDADGGAYIPDGTEPWGYGAVEGNRPNEMGTDDELYQDVGGGGNSERTDIRIDDEDDPYYYDGTGIDPKYLDTNISGILPTPDGDALIIAVRHGDYLLKSKVDIVSYLHNEIDVAKKESYIRKAYNMGLTGEFFKPDTQERMGYHVEPSGLLVYEGSYADRKTETKLSWSFVRELIEALIIDGNYLDAPKEGEQLFLFGEKEKGIESISEPLAEAKKPLIFSQAVIDEFIRLGGCTRGSTQRIYGYYRRANDAAENILFLKSEYEEDNVGLNIDGRKMSASWDEEGVCIADGEKVEGAWKSIFLSWAEIDKRTRELIELGQYIPRSQAEKADELYEEYVADKIAFFYREYLDDFPDEDKTYSTFLWPDITKFYTEILNDSQKLQGFCDEIDRNIARIEEKGRKGANRYKPHFISMLINQFLREPVEFKAADDNVLPPKCFITQDRIKRVLVGNRTVKEGKLGVYSFFLNNIFCNC